MKTQSTLNGFSIDPSLFKAVTSLVTPGVVLACWVMYLLIYWRCLFQILGATRFEPTEKILWFLVITLVPVMGIITYWILVSEKQRNLSITEHHRQLNRSNSASPGVPQP